MIMAANMSATASSMGSPSSVSKARRPLGANTRLIRATDDRRCRSFRAPECKGCAERFIRTLKENLLWIRRFATIEDLRQTLQNFKQTCDQTWIIERHGYQTPAQVRTHQIGRMPMAAQAQSGVAFLQTATRRGKRVSIRRSRSARRPAWSGGEWGGHSSGASIPPCRGACRGIGGGHRPVTRETGPVRRRQLRDIVDGGS